MAITFDPQSYLDAGVCDAEIPTVSPSPFDFAQDGAYATGGNRWFIRCGGGPAGNYMEHQTVQNQHAAFIVCQRFASQAVTAGQVWYLAYFHRVDRINGLNVWHVPAIQSFDKGLEFNGTGLRWDVAMGNIAPFADPPLDKFIMFLGNPTFHLNPTIESNDYIMHNVAPYSETNPLYLNYERWYACVLELKVATDNTGWVKGYINGIKHTEHLNIKTWANVAGIDISRVQWGGTLAQFLYDSPPHIRKIDGWIITDELSTLQARGYFSDPLFPSVSSTLVVGSRRCLI